MLFWIFVIMIVIGVIGYKLDKYDFHFGLWATTIAIGTIGVVISLIIMGCSFIGIDGQISKNKSRYDMLVYQYENNIYDNDNDLGKRELIKDIQDWNEDLAYYKESQDDFWIGIYIPNIFDQFDFIELE